MTSVLVIEDDPTTRHVLADLLARLGYDVFTADNGVHGLEMATRSEPEMIILDLGLPDISGLEVIRELRTWSQAPVLVVSGSTQVRRKSDALDAGADDFLDKPFNVAELAARLKVAERRLASSNLEASSARTFGRLMIDPISRRLECDGDEVRMTETEWLLIEALSRHPGRVITHRWLARSVWGQRAGPQDSAALRSHMRALRAKIGDDARNPTYIRTESGVGYRWICSPSTTRDRQPSDPHLLATRFRDDLGTSLQDLERTAVGDPDRRLRLSSALRALVDQVVNRAEELVSAGAADDDNGWSERPA